MMKITAESILAVILVASVESIDVFKIMIITKFQSSLILTPLERLSLTGP